MLLAILLVLCLYRCTAEYNISECILHKTLTIDEQSTQSVKLTCNNIDKAEINWSVKHPNGTESLLAYCQATSGCINKTTDISATRPRSDNSELVVNTNFRNTIAGSVVCVGLANGSVDASDKGICNVRVVYPARKCDVNKLTASITDWTVKGACTVPQVYASDEQYSCRWKLIRDNEGGFLEINGTLSKQRFIDNNGLPYYSATCSFTAGVADLMGQYIAAKKFVDPGPDDGFYSTISPPFIIARPNRDPTLVDCPPSITVGDNVNCTCLAADAKPSASISWYNDRKTNGIEGDKLVLNNVAMEMNGTTYTCQQFWGGITSGNTVKFTVTVLPPKVSPTSPSTLRTTTARTSQNPLVESTTTKNSASTGGARQDNQNGDEGVPLPAVIGAAVGGGALLIIIVIVVVVVVVKRRRGAVPKPENTQAQMHEINNEDEDFEEHHNSLYQSSDEVEPRPPPSAAAATSKPTAVATRISTNSSNYTTPDTGVYNDEGVSDLGYTYVATTAAQPNARVGTGDYSEVNEQESNSNPSPTQPTQREEYAAVNKPSAPKKKPTTSPKPQVDLYGVVNKKREGHDGETTPTADEYAVVNKPKPNPKSPVVVTGPKPKPKVALKPKPSAGAANSGNTDDGQPTVATGYEDVDLYNETRPEAKDADNEYNALSFSQKALVKPSDDADSPVYSHLKHEQ